MNFLIFVAAFIVLACVVLPLGMLAVFAAVSDQETRVETPPGEPPPPRPRETVIT